MRSVLKHPSAWLPIVLSVTMLLVLFIFFLMSGPPVPEADEGVGAHLFQLWLVLEVLMVPFFAIKWVPQQPKQALPILAIQIIAVLAVCAPVFYFKL